MKNRFIKLIDEILRSNFGGYKISRKFSCNDVIYLIWKRNQGRG